MLDNLETQGTRKLDTDLTPFTKNKLEIAINTTPDTMRFLEENIGKKFIDTSLESDVLNMTTKAQITKIEINK